MPHRCEWSGTDPLYIHYHDQEWGVPVHEDRRLFEMLLLEGAQAGLSWITILRKREAFRQAFDDFDPEKMARYGEKKMRQLMENQEIVRNRLKLRAAVQNAKAFLSVREELGSFDRFIWQFVGYQPVQNQWTGLKDIPQRTPQSEEMSKELRKRGFKFVGATICYAFMQAVGMVNDHEAGCFRYLEIKNRTAAEDPGALLRG